MNLPSILTLTSPGRTFMLAWLSDDIRSGAITPEQWREAYGRAADYETAFNARVVLAS